MSAEAVGFESVNVGKLRSRMEAMEYLKVCDFDDHLHDIANDWMNTEVTEKLRTSVAGG